MYKEISNRHTKSFLRGNIVEKASVECINVVQVRHRNNKSSVCLLRSNQCVVSVLYTNFDSSILQIPWPILVILLRAFGFIAPKTLKLFGFPIFRF